MNTLLQDPMGTSLVTAISFRFSALGARQIIFSTEERMQYFAPSGMFLRTVLTRHEPFARAQVWRFS